MHPVHLASVDLNLALILHVVLAEKSVSRAAKRLGLSQSATSHAVARLRHALGDRLVVRTRDGLVPTLRARAMAEPLGAAMALLEGAFVPKREFDPLTATRRFQIIATDYAELVLLPPLVANLGASAPRVEVRVQPLTTDTLAALRRRDVDFVIATYPATEAAPDLRSTLLLEDRLVCVVRKGHPLLAKKLTVARFASAKHVLVAPRAHRARSP
jgi:DNA-binding transcriptional LysR family regulator